MAQAMSGWAIQLELQLTHLLRTQETGPGASDRTRPPVTQPALPHQQVLDERDQRVYRGHRTGQFLHFYNSQSHFWIMANEAGPRITTTDRLHHSKPRTISLDHLTHGITRMPGKLSEVDGTSSTRIATHPDLH